MDSLRNAWMALVVLLILVVASTLCYSLIWGWSLVDALYMTLITITTTGFKEVRPLSPALKIFTLGVLVIGFGLVVYAGGNAVRAIIEEGLFRRRRMTRRIREMMDHYLICGFGRTGRVLCRELAARPLDFVVVDRDADRANELERLGYRFIHGDATDDGVLRRAGIERARGIVAGLGSDADNVFITLSARALNPGLFILARCTEPRSAEKLKAAGADRVLNPFERAGIQMAQVLQRPAVVDFMEEISRETGIHDLQMEEVPLVEDGSLIGQSLRDAPLRRELNLIVVAIERPGAPNMFNPSPDEILRAGDVLIVLGERRSLDRLEPLAGQRKHGEGGVP